MKTLIVILFLMSGSAMAGSSEEPKILICSNEYGKIGLSTQSDDLYVGRLSVKVEDLVQKAHAHGRVGVSYDPVLNQFTGSGEDGCTPVEYITEIDASGNITLNENDQITYSCRWLR